MCYVEKVNRKGGELKRLKKTVSISAAEGNKVHGSENTVQCLCSDCMPTSVGISWEHSMLQDIMDCECVF